MGFVKIKLKIDEAMNLFNEVSNKGVTPNVVTYNTLIGGFCRVEGHKVALELFHKMQACGQPLDP